MGCCAKTIRKAVHGTVGLSKAVAQSVGIPIDHCPDHITQERREICKDCPHPTRNLDPKYIPNKGLTSTSVCTKCSCLIVAKTMLASEHCPINKWHSVKFRKNNDVDDREQETPRAI